MATVYDYLQWRGDLTFDERPFNDADNLILSTLVYLDFSDILPNEEQGTSMRLEDACRALITKSGGDIKPYVRSLAKLDTRFVEALLQTRRFCDVRLSAYVDRVVEKRSLQFAAMQTDLPHAGTYLAFRGTDTTLVGWRENFRLSYTITEAQHEAARYLLRAIVRVRDVSEQIRVGGHSKGGNLAEFAATHCPAHLRRHILRVYSNDGPSLVPEVTKVRTQEVLGSTFCHIVPAFSVIGMLFTREDDPLRVVKSYGQGIEQHDPTTWQVLPDGLDRTDTLSSECMVLNRTIASWIDGVELEEREQMIREVFDALQAGGATTFDQIVSSREQIKQVISALSSCDRHTRDIVLDLVQSVASSSVGVIGRAAKDFVAEARRRLPGKPGPRTEIATE